MIEFTIVRGKAGRPVEFGAKVSVSLVEGYSIIERMSWDNFNESKDLIGQIEGYRRPFAYTIAEYILFQETLFI